MCYKIKHKHIQCVLTHIQCASTVIPLLPKATFAPSIQPNLGLPRTRPLPTSAINTIWAVRYSSILSKCPNYLNTHWSALLADSCSIPALLHTSSFLSLFIRDTQTKHLKHYISQEHSLSFSQHFSNSMPLLRTTLMVQLLLHLDTFHHEFMKLLCKQLNYRIKDFN